ncbi:hypothetical protein Tco_0167178 [Tanacetum coccineum]
MLAIKLSSSYGEIQSSLIYLSIQKKLSGYIDGVITASSSTITTGTSTSPNLAYATWLAADQRALILIQYSLFEEAIAKTLGHATARAIYKVTHDNEVDVLFSDDMFLIQNRLTKETLARCNHKNRLYVLEQVDVAKREEEVGKDELVDLLGIDVVTNVYKAKIKNGPITLKVYREDGSDEVIPNFKASELHLAKWREVMQAYTKRTRVGWTTIYKQIQIRIENLHKTEQELGIDFNKPLGEQDPLDKLIDLQGKKESMMMTSLTTSGLP